MKRPAGGLEGGLTVGARKNRESRHGVRNFNKRTIGDDAALEILSCDGLRDCSIRVSLLEPLETLETESNRCPLENAGSRRRRLNGFDGASNVIIINDISTEYVYDDGATTYLHKVIR